jgi:hypothetical protein
MPSAVYNAAIAAFDQAMWQHSDPNASETVGISQLIEGRMIGGSLRVYNGTLVRFLAFGHGDVAPKHVGRVKELFAQLNPLLLNGSLEIDDIVGAVCRASVNLEGLLDMEDELRDEGGAQAVLFDLALAATGVYTQVLPAIEAVEAGGDVAEAVASVGLVAPASIPA